MNDYFNILMNICLLKKFFINLYIKIKKRICGILIIILVNLYEKNKLYG